ncbi:MAG TPA: hypothetical protein PLQ56_17650 [Aggregatilineales bacterium]|nr:hypothetical protein [Anaerolineae bacterium]HUN08435.1 hypothetical protein [Aggregatilineales bacterium]
MGKTVVLVVVFIIFSLALVSAAYAGYSGVGLIQTGGPSARVGSIGGPLVIGGGPNSGK